MKNRMILIYARIQVWSDIISSVCILSDITILVASYYDYSEVIENDCFQIQVTNLKKKNNISFWAIVSDTLVNIFLRN